MIGAYRRWRARVHADYDARLQSLLAQHPHDHPFVVEGLLSGIPAIAAASSRTITEAAKRRDGEERIRAIVREELQALASRNSDAFMSRALAVMKES